MIPQVSLEPAEVRDWSRSMDDPFLGEWEQIHAFVRDHPMTSGGEILREWQRRFPGRFERSHQSTLQCRLREIRASLLASQAKPPVGEVVGASTSGSLSEPAKALEASPQTDALPGAFPNPVPIPSSEREAAWPSSMPPTTEEEARPDLLPLALSGDPSSGEGEVEDQEAPTILMPPDLCKSDELLSARMTIDQAVRAFLQDEHTQEWESKTLEWHQTSLKQLQSYLAWRGLILLSSLTSSEIRGWLTFLRTELLKTGGFRVNNTIATYARSVHAFCSWLIVQGYLKQTPFAQVKMPKMTRRRLHLIEPETFERLLHACHAAGAKRATMDHATVRNRALLWVLWDTGLLVSEVCALDLEDVDLPQSTLHIRGTGSRRRSLPLTPQVQQALAVYLERYRLRAGKPHAHDPFFLSEQRGRLTPNVFTLLFQRLCRRAGLEDLHLTPTMLRDMFAIRFLQADGAPKALQRLLGLAESTPIKRYQDAARSFPHWFSTPGKLNSSKNEL